MMTAGTGRHARWILLAAGAALLLAAAGCKKDEPPPPSKKAEPAVRDGLSEDWRLDHPECAEARKIAQAEPGTPEALLRQVFEAASAPDGEESFQKFYATLDPEKYEEKWVRGQFWERIRTHVDKYVEGPQDPTYIVCREDRNSDEQTKLFVFSKVSSKSHTPYGFRKRDGEWRIEFFTP